MEIERRQATSGAMPSRRPNLSALVSPPTASVTFAVPKRYRMVKVIGAGASGVVAAALENETKEVAIKKITNISKCAPSTARILREIQIMRHFSGPQSHPNVLGLHDLTIPVLSSPDNTGKVPSFDELYIVTERLNSNVSKALHYNVLSEMHIQFLMHQLLLGLQHIHAADVIHRDLKPDNLFINSNCDLKIGDWGLARSIHDPNDYGTVALTQYVVTRWYRAPEILLRADSYGKPADIWSAGCIFAELFLREPFLVGSNDTDQISKILQITGKPDTSSLKHISNQEVLQFIRSLPKYTRPQSLRDAFPVGTQISEQALDLMQKMLEFCPTRRLTVEECLMHPFFATIHRPEEIHDTPPTFRSTPLNLTRDHEADIDTCKKVLLNEYVLIQSLRKKTAPPPLLIPPTNMNPYASLAVSPVVVQEAVSWTDPDTPSPSGEVRDFTQKNYVKSLNLFSRRRGSDYSGSPCTPHSKSNFPIPQ